MYIAPVSLSNFIAGSRTPVLKLLKQPEVGNLFCELRQFADLTQVQLVESLGVAYATINRWENRHTLPSPLVLKQISRLIDEFSCLSSNVLQAGSQRLLKQYSSLEG